MELLEAIYRRRAVREYTDEPVQESQLRSLIATAEGKALLGLPPAHVPIAPLIVGHPKGTATPSNRHQPEVRWLE